MFADAGASSMQAVYCSSLAGEAARPEAEVFRPNATHASAGASLRVAGVLWRFIAVCCGPRPIAASPSASVGGVLRSCGGVEDSSMDESCIPRGSFRVTHRPCAETLPEESALWGLLSRELDVIDEKPCLAFQIAFVNFTTRLQALIRRAQQSY